MPEAPSVPVPANIQHEHFETYNEDWNEYELRDGIRVRVKTVVTGIGRALDPNGQLMRTPEGNPLVRVSHTTLVTAYFGEKSDA